MTTIQQRIKDNLARLAGALPAEGAKGAEMPMPGDDGTPPPAAPAGLAGLPPAKPSPGGGGAGAAGAMGGAPEPDGDEDEDEGDELGAEAGKSFYEGCASKKCGRCIPCIERGAEAGKAAGGGPAAVAEVGADVLAKLIGAVVAQHLKPVTERLKSIEAAQALNLEATNGSLEAALKGVEAMGLIARQPAANPLRPGAAVGRVTAHNPGAARASGVTALGDTTAGPFPLSEREVFKAVRANLLSPTQAQAWWNAGHPSNAGPEGVNVILPGLPENIVEATKAL